MLTFIILDSQKLFFGSLWRKNLLTSTLSSVPEGVLVIDLRHRHECVCHRRANVCPDDNGHGHVDRQCPCSNHGHNDGCESGAALNRNCALKLER